MAPRGGTRRRGKGRRRSRGDDRRTARPGENASERYPLRPENSVELSNPREERTVHRAVQVEDGDGSAARSIASQGEVGDVDSRLAQKSPEAPHHPRAIVVGTDQHLTRGERVEMIFIQADDPEVPLAEERAGDGTVGRAGTQGGRDQGVVVHRVGGQDLTYLQAG